MFDQFYHQSGDQLKLSFLHDVFRKYPNLKEDFLAFYLNHANRPLKMTVNDPDDFILASVDLIKDDLESIDVLEPYLSAIIHTGAEAAVLLDVIEDKKAAELVPWLYTETKRKAGGQQEWEQAARKVFKKSVSVASSMLEFYKNNNKPAFLRTAKELWAAGLFQVELAKFYFDDLNPADDPDFYKAVTLCLNSQRFSKKYYRVLQTLMEKEERLRYISTIKWNKPAYVSALCMEEKYTEALKFARQ